MREAFEGALKADRYDQTTRWAFSDWLEENGFDEEACEQRKWTFEWQEAYDWLEGFLVRLNRVRREYADVAYDPRENEPISMEHLLDCGRGKAEIFFYGYDTPDEIYAERITLQKNLCIVLRTDEIEKHFMYCSC